jgi:hypothetical protein
MSSCTGSLISKGFQLATCVCLAIATVGIARAQSAGPNANTKEEQLQQDFTDPLTTLPQVILRDSWSPAVYGTNVQTNQAIIRPLIPRIPPHALLPLLQIVRPTFSLVTVPSSRGGSRTEFGDTALFDLVVLPWPARKSGLLMGIGPAFIFPTATSRSAGQGAWQAGPAFGAIYRGVPGLLIGGIVQNTTSFAYSSAHRPPQNTLSFQPVVALHLIGQWYLRSAEATWTIGWHHGTATMLPLGIAVGRTIVGTELPPMSIFAGGQWMVYRQFAPVAPQTTINFGMTVAFPQIRNIWR